MRRPRKRVAKKVRLEVNEDSDAGSHDNDFISISDSQSSESVSGSGDEEMLTNAEVCKLHSYYIYSGQLIPSFVQLADILPSKTVPTTGRGSQKRKRHSLCSVTAEEVEDGNSGRHLSVPSKSRPNDTIIEEIPSNPSSESATPTGASKEKKKVRD
jgi:hypothetical protein